jgi:hypothetical protein
LHVAQRITFGMIVLNGEPFVRYNLRQLYPFAHEIIVVEGAAPGAAAVATPEGHSRDGTLETLRRFQRDEDPEGKLTVVTAEDEGHPDGFWPGEKHEQSQAYARRATGNWLWQVDVDEFYRADEVTRLLTALRQRPDVHAVSFKQTGFWASPRFQYDGWYLRHLLSEWHRLFRWGPGYRYVTHRPPTVVDADGQELRGLGAMGAEETEAMGVRLYHYSQLFPRQVREKCEYYRDAEWARRRKALRWYDRCFMRLQCPYRIHNVYSHPSWLERYSGPHPRQVCCMLQDVRRDLIDEPMRDCADVDELLNRRSYHFGRTVLKALTPLTAWWDTWPMMVLRRGIDLLITNPRDLLKKIRFHLGGAIRR